MKLAFNAAWLASFSLCLIAAGCAPSASPTGGGGGTADLSCASPACRGLCVDDSDCAGGRRCDTEHHTCVDCVEDRDCPANSVCSRDNHYCVMGCSAQRACPSDGGVCELDSGACLECVVDDDCKTKELPQCRAGRCVACNPDHDSCPAGLYCAIKGQDFACTAGCKADADCAGDAGTGHCDTKAHRCVECNTDDDCPAGRICTGGACVPGCGPNRPCQNGQPCCGDQCADVTGDSNNCGACGNACNGGWNCCRSTCVDPSNDLMNCGGCGVVCAVSHGTPACSLRTCAVAACDAGWGDCDGVYKDGCETHLDNNPANCGACGNTCIFPHAFPGCAAGACQIDSCLYPWQDCDGSAQNGCETNTLADVANCGACGHACRIANGMAACVASQCAVGACNMGFADCNGLSQDGCEAKLDSNLVNCGACGHVCVGLNGVPSCSMGACAIVCNGGFGDCNHVPDDGCETNLLGDIANCGACGNACSMNHAQSTCAQGTCQITKCDFGWSDCNGDPKDGCEANLLTDPKNCGTCKTVCSNNHIANPACDVAICDGACDAGFADCDKNKQSNGCEVNINSDVNNCGACGNVCGAVANATPGCNAGQCGIGACNAHFADCDKSAANGCEVNLLTDNNNCGACANVCPMGQSCSNGVCVLPSNACSVQEAEHPAYTTVNRDVALCGNTYSPGDMRTACAPGWHVCLLGEWTARFPKGSPPGGALTSWGASQANRCPGNVWQAGQPVHLNPVIWSGNVCNSPYNPWNAGKYLFADDNTTILKGNGSCCSWDSAFSSTGDSGGFAVYCCR